MPFDLDLDTPAVRDRVKRGRPHLLSKGWRQAAERFAAEHRISAELVLDRLDEIACMYLYGGTAWPEAQGQAWLDTVELLTPRRVA